MKKVLLSVLVITICLVSRSAFSQTDEVTEPALDLSGDNLDLYAVLDFQKSETIEDFEKSLNLKETEENCLILKFSIAQFSMFVKTGIELK